MKKIIFRLTKMYQEDRIVSISVMANPPYDFYWNFDALGKSEARLVEEAMSCARNFADLVKSKHYNRTETETFEI
jgi:hypothetical protein